MLTTQNASAKKAVEYFLQGYYQEGKSRWFGIGAEELGVTGAVDSEEVFTNIVQGKSPDGTQNLCARETASESRRAALDCTFEAPKSVSLTALPGGDERLVECHVKAVEQSLALMQQYCAHTRVTIDKQRQLINTGNLVVAQFDHIESRELDPHLHTHCLVMNMVQTPSGEWYSHVNDAIVQQKKYWGMVYQQFLAAEVQKLGYEVEWKAHGQFELKGYTEEEIKEFSKRRQQILEVVGHNSTWAERERAWRITRRGKEEVKPEELLVRWKQEAELLGIKFVKPTKSAVEIEQTTPQQQQQLVEALPTKQEIAQELIEDAIRHCSSRDVTFALEDLEKFVLETVGTTIDPTQLKPLFCLHPELKSLELKRGVRYTTETALWQDRATIHLMRQGQGAVEAIARPDEVKAHLEATQLNTGQRSAVMLAATATDQFMLLEGVAGSGKTWMLRELKAIAEPSGYIFKGFGVTSDAEKELWKKAGIESTTLASLLCSKLPDEPQPNQIWVVDEAGMSSAKDCYQLLKRATAENARVILVGDKRQFSAVEAGNPFKLLQHEGILTAYMEESVRQKNQELKVAVDLIAQGKIKQGFTRLEDSGSIIKCVADKQAAAIVDEYMKVLPEKRADTLVLVGTHAERLLITQAIRDALKAEGSLGQSEVKLTALRSIEGKNDLSKVKLEYTHNFEVGNIVVPTRSYKRRQLEKGVAYEVVGKTKDHLHLKSTDGTILTVDPKFSKSVYSQQEIEIAVGDRLRWTKRSNNLGRYNGDELLVTAIEGNQATIQYVGSARTETIDLTQPQHLDYTIVRTKYSAQGKDADRVLIAADKCVSTESFYVAVSRVKQELKLFTQDPETLLAQALVSKANKSALDEWREHIEQQMKAEATAEFKKGLGASSIQEIAAIQLTTTQESFGVSELSVDEPEIAAEDNSQPLYEGFNATSLGQSIAQQLLDGSIDTSNEDSLQQLVNRSAEKPAAPKVEPLVLPFEFNNSKPVSFLPTGKGVGASNLINLAQQKEAKQLQNLEQVEHQQRQADKNTDVVLADVEKLVADYSTDKQQSPESLLSQKQVNQPEIHQAQSYEIQPQDIQFDAANLGKSIAAQLETTDAEELQPQNTSLLLKASNRQQLVPPLQLLQLKQNPTVSIPPFQGKTDQLLNTESDLTGSLQLDHIEQLQHRADKTSDAAMARLEKINQTAPQNAPKLVNQQVSTKPEQQETTYENTTTRDTQQPERFNATDLGRSIAASLEACDERTKADQAVPERLLLRARSTLKARRSPGAIEQFSHRILQPGNTAPQQHSRLPIPTSGRTQAVSIQRDADESDRSLARQLEQIDQRQRTADTQTERTLTRLGNYHADFTTADETAIPLIADSRTIGTDARDEATLGQHSAAIPSNQQQQPTVEESSNKELVSIMLPDATAAGAKQNYQRIAHSSQAPKQSAATNLRTANENHRIIEQQRESLKALADSMRSLDLEDIASRLGLEPDRYDKHKWRGEGQIISINDQKFYNHLTQQGGYGAIDLVMHVQGQDFKQALSWLSNGISDLPPPKVRSHSPTEPKVPESRQPFTPPVADETKWAAVRQYLTEKRQLPTALVDELHRLGKVYADTKQNAVFIRESFEGDITGASLRGTYKDSQFKGLATGSRRDGGWFSFTAGEGKLEQIVLTEAAIDALSAAALSKQHGKTMFIASDGKGATPIELLRQAASNGTKIIVAHDADRVGEQMAWEVASQLPSVIRATPAIGKDWNQQLVGNAEAILKIGDWKAIAQALGKSEDYINRIATVTLSAKTGIPLPENVTNSMQQDNATHQQTSTDLWQWYEAAKGLGKSEQYLHRIADVAIAFHHPTQPTPIPEKAVAAMQQDNVQYDKLMAQSLWQHYSQGADPRHPMKTAITVAVAAMNDGYKNERLQRILEYDPQLRMIRQRSGEQAAQSHLNNAIRNAEYRIRTLAQPMQNQQQRNQKPGLQR